MNYLRKIFESKTAKRIIFAMFSQGLYAALGIVISLILPVYMAPAEYGKWQIYFFYSAYLNFVGLGYNDGIQLKLAGKDYESLDFTRYRTNNILIAGYGLIATILLLAGTLLIKTENEEIYILLFVSILPTIFFNIFNAFFISTNRSVLYNMSNLLYKLLFCVGVVILIWCGKKVSIPIVVCDIISKTFMTIVLMSIGYKLILGRVSGAVSALQDIWHKCKAGCVIMLTVLVSGLLPVAGRIIVEHQESIEVYGIYSFGISLLSVILTFTNTIGIIIFPVIKKYSDRELKKNYQKISTSYDIALFGIFNFYFLGTAILTKIAPDYTSMLVYLPLLFAMSRTIGKLQLFLFPYYKYFEHEKQYLLFSSVGLGIMIVGCWAGYVTGGVFGVALMSFLIMELFYYVVERYLYTKIWKMKNVFDFKSTILSSCFIIIGIMSGNKYFSLAYLGIYIVYVGVYLIGIKKNRED